MSVAEEGEGGGSPFSEGEGGSIFPMSVGEPVPREPPPSEGVGSVIHDPSCVIRDLGSVVRDQGAVFPDPGSVTCDP